MTILSHRLRAAQFGNDDPYFNQVVALLHFDGSLYDDSRTFVNNAPDGLTFSFSGNPCTGSYNPYGQCYSVFFDGSSRLRSVSGASLNIGTTTDFTLECWVNVRTGAYNTIFQSSTGVSDGCMFRVEPDNSVGFYKLGNTTPLVDSGTAKIGLGKWAHLAVSRQSGTMRLFINGVLVDTATNSNSFTSGGSNAIIGQEYLNSAFVSGFSGYISDLRLIIGTAIYTNNFQVPSKPLTALTNTALLTCSSNRYLDKSVNGWTITSFDGTGLYPFSPYTSATGFSPASGGSVHFNRSNLDSLYLDPVIQDEFSFGRDAFTYEAWIYMEDQPLSGEVYTIFDSRGGTTSNIAPTLQYRYTGTAYELRYLSGTTVRILYSASLYEETWYHIALVRSGTRTSLFLNGLRVASTATDISDYSTSYRNFIGATTAAGSGCFNGYISDARIVKGNAVYDPTQTICTVPTSPLTAVTGTVVLLNATNSGFLDQATCGNYVSGSTNSIYPYVDTYTKQFGTGSLNMYYGNEYLETTDKRQLYDFSRFDFTIEAWIYPLTDTLTVDQRIVSKGANGNSNFTYTLRRTTSSQLQFSYSTDGINTSNLTSASNLIVDGAWYHVAVSRVGNDIMLFINGVQVATVSTTASLFNSGDNLCIGTNGNKSGNFWSGWIDDIRITRGVGRYAKNSNFTPPTRAFSNF